MSTITHEFLVCDDCAQIIANAATSMETGSETTDIAAESLAKNWPEANIVLDFSNEDDHTDFSDTPCGGCDTTLAGGRTPAVVFND